MTSVLATAGTAAPADAAARKTFNVTVSAVDKATNAPITATARIVQGTFVKTGPTPLTASLKQASVSITIQDPTDYKFSNWSTGSTVQPLVFIVKADTTVSALFNKVVVPPPPASLTVVKNIVNNDGGTGILADFTLMVDGQVVQNGTAVQVSPGVSHTVTESTSAGQTDKYTASFSASCPNGVITVQSGQSLVCTITNNDITPPPPPASLTVVKNIVNNDGGTGILADFTLMVDGQVVQNGTAVQVSPGVSHTVTESTSAGQTDKYTASFSASCPNGVITVQSGQSLVCTITNNDITPLPAPDPWGSFYIPLYRIANHPAVADAKLAHPNVEFMVSINPSNGPGNNEDPRFDPAIQVMRNAGVEKIIGYVPTWYGRATQNPPQGSPYTGIVYNVTIIKAYIDRYVQWYNVDGIAFDEVSTSTDPIILDFYQQITDYARSKGLAMLKANPGIPTPEVYIQMFDNTGIFESATYPSESAIQSATYFNTYPREKFTIVIHSSPTLNEAWLSMALNYVKYVYITNDGGSNPYDQLPSFMESELLYLDQDN